MIRLPPRSTRKESSAASDVYKRQILDGVPLFETYETPDDVKMAINGAVFNHGTRMLGIALKKAVGSTKGNLSDHEGIVIRGLEDRPVKVTGDFIVKGATGAIKDKIKAKFQNNKQELIDKINKDIDIPFINEKTEEKALKFLFKHVEKWLNE